MYFRCEEASKVPWHCEMPSEMSLSRGAQQCAGINETGEGEHTWLVWRVCEGDRLRQEFVIRVAMLGKAA